MLSSPISKRSTLLSISTNHQRTSPSLKAAGDFRNLSTPPSYQRTTLTDSTRRPQVTCFLGRICSSRTLGRTWTLFAFFRRPTWTWRRFSTNTRLFRPTVSSMRWVLARVTDAALVTTLSRRVAAVAVPAEYSGREHCTSSDKWARLLRFAHHFEDGGMTDCPSLAVQLDKFYS